MSAATMGNMLFLLNDKCESALAALVMPAAFAVEPEINVYPGKSSAERALPCVICGADGDGLEDPKGTGNFWMDCYVAIEHGAVPNEDGTSPDGPDPKVADQALVSAVFGGLMVEDLAAQLSAAGADFTVFPMGVIFGAPEGGRNEDGVWIDRLPIRLYCCGRALG